jgi:L-serine dehydratase
MKKSNPSIFNDVIGPVMIGPSSSHTAASARIGLMISQMIKGNPVKLEVDFHKEGSLAQTYHGHGSDIGLVGGLLGLQPENLKIKESLLLAEKIGLEISFNIKDYQASHPNTYKMTLTSDLDERIFITALSTGGGMFKIIKVNNFDVCIKGDYFETLIFLDNPRGFESKEVENLLSRNKYQVDDIYVIKGKNKMLISVKTVKEIDNGIIKDLIGFKSFYKIIRLKPVLPTLSNKDSEVPFYTIDEMKDVAKKDNLDLYQLALLYESKRGSISKDAVYKRMEETVEIMISSIDNGLKGTDYSDRILGPQAYMIEKNINSNKMIKGEVFNKVIESITAIMEVKSSMGVFVAAPTGGAAGALPGTIIGTAFAINKTVEDITKAMLAASMIGIFIAKDATFAGEVGGCQAECGSASGMAAAGLVQLMDGSVEEALDAASMALQNVLGLVCDPVGKRVEVPCLGKNILAGTNALASANMSLAGFNKVVPLDETIKAMDAVGQMIPVELRCTELAGLSVTKTSKKIARNLN